MCLTRTPSSPPWILAKPSNRSPCFCPCHLFPSQSLIPPGNHSDSNQIETRSHHASAQNYPRISHVTQRKAEASQWPLRPDVIWLLLSLWCHFLLFSALLGQLLSYWPPHCSMNIPGMFLPQGPCKCCFHFLEERPTFANFYKIASPSRYFMLFFLLLSNS